MTLAPARRPAVATRVITVALLFGGAAAGGADLAAGGLSVGGASAIDGSRLARAQARLAGAALRHDQAAGTLRSWHRPRPPHLRPAAPRVVWVAAPAAPATAPPAATTTTAATGGGEPESEPEQEGAE